MFTVNPEKYEFYLEELVRIRFRIDRFLLMPKHEAWLRREAFIRQAYSSTMIENASISEEERARAESQLTIARPDVANFARALEFVDFMSSSGEVLLDELLIRQIHWHLMRGIRDDHYFPGEYRKATNWIEDAGVRVYQPPHAIDVSALMREFVQELRNSTLHPVLKAGVAHLHLIAIHPFVDGNGRTARLLATLILQSSGWGFRNLLSLDRYYQGDRKSYIEALSKTLGSKYPNDYDPHPWLEFYCPSVVSETRFLESKLTEVQMMFDKIHQDLRKIGLLDRQIDGLLYALRTGSIARRDYIEINEVSPLTATRDLAVLVKKGLLKPEGNSRNRVYRVIRPEAQPQEQQAELL